MPAQSNVGTMIKRARERKRWTQRQLADAVGVNVKTVDNWEAGRTSPRNRLGALEEVLGVALYDEQKPGPDELAGLLPPADDWEAGVLSDSDLPDNIKRKLITDSRRARSAYAARRSERRAEAQREVTRRATDQAS